MSTLLRQRHSRILAAAAAAFRIQGPARCGAAASAPVLELFTPHSCQQASTLGAPLATASRSFLLDLSLRGNPIASGGVANASGGVQSQWLRGMSTHVGHGSGGRERGHTLHEPPESHPFAVKGLNHIALAVPNLARASEHYRTVFGAQVSDPHPLPKHGVTVVFVHIGSTTIELLEPLGENSPITKFLEKHPRGGIHHLCFTVDNIDTASQHVVDEGVRVLGDYVSTANLPPGEEKPAPTAQIGAHGNPVIFLDPRDNLGVLCELEQVFCHER